MNIISTLKKVFNSYDFRGNRIKNLRVDTPTEDIEYYETSKGRPNPDSGYFGPNDDIYGSLGKGGVQHYVANKRYVDQKTTLNTDRTWQWRVPFKFPWMTDIVGKPYKEVLDELFYPRLQHEFISPEVTDVQIFPIERPLIDVPTIDNNFKKFVIYNGCQNTFEIRVYQEANDWISGLTAQLILVKNNNTEQRIDFSKTTDNSVSVFKCNILWNDSIKAIKFRRVFDNFKEFTDTWNYPSVPETETFTLEKDITEYFTKICFPFTLRINNNGVKTYTDRIYIDSKTPKEIQFCKFNIPFYSTTNSSSRSDVNDNNFGKLYCLEAYIYDEQGNYINKVELSSKNFNDTLGSSYHTFDFGYFPNNVIIQIVPKFIRLIN